jgi:hypothetical protein
LLPDTTPQDNSISWFGVLKDFTLALLFDFTRLSFKQYFCLFIIFLSFVTIINNIIISTQEFYFSFCQKKKILETLKISELEWFNPYLFLNEVPELYFLHEIQQLFAIFVWKFFFGILIIVPVLLIIAYSTLLERKLLSAAQR